MTTPYAHLICLSLVAVDFLARTWRMQWLLTGLRQRLPFAEVFTQSVLGEAASSLTPLRLGGEPARIWAMTRAGVPVTVATVGIGVEIVVMAPVTLIAAAFLFGWLAPEWWASVAPAVSSGIAKHWRPVLAIAVALLAASALVNRLAPETGVSLRREVAAARLYARRMPRAPLVASVPLTLISAAARVAILPVLALTLPYEVPLGAVVIGSFILLFGQLLLPTPAGAGVVEVGFLAGAAGEMGPDEMGLLLAWRFYTTFVGVAVGVGLALHHYGFRTIIARRRAVSASAYENDVPGN